jgi:gamma-glutamyltranspeptidase/glutathione hydrolase
MPVRSGPPPAVAAGHPATAATALEILTEGGTAADAAVAASLASCAAEVVMTGLAGGGYALWYDAASGEVSLLDFFVAVPGLERPEGPTDVSALEVPFGDELITYHVGVGTFAVPGVVAGLDALWQRHGTLPWARLCEPAARIAREGVPMPRAHISCLNMLEPVMTMREGAEIFTPGGTLLVEGDLLVQHDLANAFGLLADEGPGSFYRGTISDLLIELMEERRGLVTRADLDAYEAVWSSPSESEYAGRRLLTRVGLGRLAETLGRLPKLAGLTAAERAVTIARLLDAPAGVANTTALVTVDREGNACSLTSSLGLGTGDYLRGLQIHLNSMLGEVHLVVDPLVPGERMGSMIAPTMALDDDGLVLAAGSAGGARLTGALVQVLSGILEEGLEPQAAVDRPRLHAVDGVAHLEPGFEPEVAPALAQAGYQVREWALKHHFFGGTAVVGRDGPGADPRRSGAALVLPE